MTPFGWSLWVWFKSKPLAQGVAAALGAVGVFWGWMTLRDRRLRREVEQEIELKAERTARVVVDRAREKTDDVVREAEQARADIPRGTPSGELPKSVQNILFDD